MAPAMHRRGAQGGFTMVIDLDIVAPLLALIAGILILIFPRILNYVVAIYLIVIGLLGLLPYFTG
jgi:hypothetical protein